MSVADLAQHLVDADVWLFTKASSPLHPAMRGHAGLAGVATPEGYAALLNHLVATGMDRANWIARLSGSDLERVLPDERFGGEVTLWWVIVRGNLDHEVHHRGQLAAYLRFMSSSRG